MPQSAKVPYIEITPRGLQQAKLTYHRKAADLEEAEEQVQL